MPSKPCEVKVLRFHLTGYRHVGGSSATLQLWMFDTFNTDWPFAASKPCDAKIRRSTSEPICTMKYLMPRKTKYAVPLPPVRWRRRRSRSLSQWFPTTRCGITLRRFHRYCIAPIIWGLLYRDKLGLTVQAVWSLTSVPRYTKDDDGQQKKLMETSERKNRPFIVR